MEASNEHYRKLERMYLSAPVNTEIYNGVTLEVSDEKAELTLKVEDKFFHAAHAIHGSVYFKMLDDAAFFGSQFDCERCFCLYRVVQYPATTACDQWHD